VYVSGPHLGGLVRAEHTVVDEDPLHLGDRVPPGLGRQLVRRAVLGLRVGGRVRVRPNHVAVQQGGTDAGAHVVDDRLRGAANLEVVGAVEVADVEPAEPAHPIRHRCRLLVRGRNRDGEAVVGDDVEHRKVQVAGGVQALPELALAARAFAEADVRQLVAVRGQAELGTAHDVASGLGAPDGGDALAAGGARLRHEVEVLAAPVARHLAPTARGVLGRPDGLEEDLLRRDAEPEHERHVPVVREEPVVPRTEVAGEGQAEGLVAGAGDLEEHPALFLHADLAVVERSRDARQTEVADELVRREAVQGAHVRAPGTSRGSRSARAPWPGTPPRRRHRRLDGRS
jgi:hypothetical protein